MTLWCLRGRIRSRCFYLAGGNRNCFFTRFVVKRHAYGATKIGAFFGYPPQLERARGDFSIVRVALRSHERPETEGAERQRRHSARAGAGEGERANQCRNRCVTTK